MHSSNGCSSLFIRAFDRLTSVFLRVRSPSNGAGPSPGSSGSEPSTPARSQRQLDLTQSKQRHDIRSPVERYQFVRSKGLWTSKTTNSGMVVLQQNLWSKPRGESFEPKVSALHKLYEATSPYLTRLHGPSAPLNYHSC